MIKIYVGREKTSSDDIVLNSEDNFPVAYIGRGSYTGNVKIHTYHSFSVQEETHLIYIGRYSSIGDNIQIYCDINHDYRSVYMGVIPEFSDPDEDAPIRERLGQITTRMGHKGTVIIGNDVWIGNDVTLISDVTIGNGAVIGAGSVVAKDIPPYTIWCGNPAVCIANRFDRYISDGLQKISWWDYDKSMLKSIEADMKGEPLDFVNKYVASAPDCKNNPSPIEPAEDRSVMSFFIDTDSDYPTYGNVLESFITKYTSNGPMFVLCYDRNKEKDVEAINGLLPILSTLEGRIDIKVVSTDPEDEPSVISHSDSLILGRDTANIRRISYAFKYGVDLISGVNIPMFK